MKKGFTLIEVLVVAVIVAILAAVAIPAYTAYIKSTKLDVDKNIAATIVSSAAVYYSKYPTATMVYSKAGYDIGMMGWPSDMDVQVPQGYIVGDISGGEVTIEYWPDDSGAEVLVGDGVDANGAWTVVWNAAIAGSAAP